MPASRIESTIRTFSSAGNTGGLAMTIRLLDGQTRKKRALPGILTRDTPTPPSNWPDNRFDVIWTLTKTADGWHFTQLPELVLPPGLRQSRDER